MPKKTPQPKPTPKRKGKPTPNPTANPTANPTPNPTPKPTASSLAEQLREVEKTLSDVANAVDALSRAVNTASKDIKDLQGGVAQAMRSAGETYSEATRLRLEVTELRETLNSVCTSNADSFDAQIDTLSSFSTRLTALEVACGPLIPSSTPTATPDDEPPPLDDTPEPTPLATEAANALGKIVSAALTEIVFNTKR